jgi:hypothetical protein
MPATRTVARAAALAAAALLLPACAAGGTAAKNPSTSTAPVTQAPVTPSASPTPTVVALDKTFWYGGFELKLTQATWLQRDSGAQVRLALGLRNLGNAAARLSQRDIALTVGGKSVSAQLTDLPEVPGKSKNDGAMSFYVEGPFAIEGTSLTWGAPDANQAVVPLGTGTPQTYEPKVLKASGALGTAQVKAVLSAGVLDASWAPAERDKYVLRLPMEFSYLGTASGGYYLTPDAFTLTLPNGNSVTGTPIAPGDLVAEAVSHGHPVDKMLAFKAANPGTGPFTLVFKDSSGATAKVTVSVA